MPPPPLPRTIYTGTFIHTPTFGALLIREELAVGVDEDGVIRFIGELSSDNESGQKNTSNKSGGDGRLDEEVEKTVKRLAIEWGWGEEGWKWVGCGRGREGRSWWFPGFVDTHIHAPQYPNTGLFGKTTLLSWLTTYTYPLESSLVSPVKARAIYTSCVSRTITHGTTTAAYFATAHAASTNILASLCLSLGQRAFVGRVCMDTDLSPPYYRDASPAFAIAETKSVIAHINAIDPDHTLLTPILTPRFALSCSPTLLSDLGSLAAETSLPIQTHISENPSECALVAKLFPSAPSYAHVYHTHGLLTPRTILAHGIHLSPSERTLIREKGSNISHCPVSNTALSSGLCPVRELLDEGITVGLGTDVSGGYSSSVLVAAREASMVSRTLAALVPEEENTSVDVSASGASDEPDGKRTTTVQEHKKLSVEEVLYLATRGGAHCLGLGDKVGAFEVGMEWDAQLVALASVDPDGGGCDEAGIDKADLGEVPRVRHTQLDSHDPHNPDEHQAKRPQDEGPVELWGQETWEEKVAKWLFCGDDRNTKAVYVRGRLVHERA